MTKLSLLILRPYKERNEHNLLMTMLTTKILFTINSLKKQLFCQNTIYNSFRLKKTLSFD